jgi:hypothetical protein
MKLDRRAFVAATAAAAALPSRLAAQGGAVLRPEDFGARGDGVTNDTRAFAALSAEVNRRGGGTIALASGRTYIVGAQARGGPYGWTPSPIVELRNLRSPLRILGNGARLRCQPGLRFGVFDLGSGRALRRPMPNYRQHEIASPYRAMIDISGASAAIEIRDLELDGNLERLQLGGPYGDTGWQIPASGIFLANNRGPETVANVLSHHHGQDGAMIDGDDRRAARSRFTRFVARHNGRQGLSLVGGRGYDFEDCEFSHTGRSAIASAPGAGVDIEAEGRKTIRDLTFERCRFADNYGVGMLADSGDSEGARFSNCQFIGTTGWSAWPKKPRFAFDNCTFVGAVTTAHADRDPARATRFTGCRFTDDPSLSPTGRVFPGEPAPGGAIVNLPNSDNVLFDRCTFDVGGASVLPWSWKALYRDCTMRQRSARTAMTKGKYLGTTTISGPVDLYGSMVIGTLTVNGRRIPPGPVGGDVRPW